MKYLSLYRFNHFTGYWQHIRKVDADTASDWLRVFQEDEPACVFRVAFRKPKPTDIPAIRTAT